jgi:hypothetical protein
MAIEEWAADIVDEESRIAFDLKQKAQVPTANAEQLED